MTGAHRDHAGRGQDEEQYPQSVSGCSKSARTRLGSNIEVILEMNAEIHPLISLI